jgi:hypothetical protein
MTNKTSLFNRSLSGAAVAIAIIVFVVTAYRTYDNLTSTEFKFSTNMFGFDGISQDDIPFNSLKDSFNTSIKSYNSKAASAKTTLIWIGFIVTALTGASTLISSIQAAKDTPDSHKRAMVIIAILTFLATLGNWGNTTFSERKDEATQTTQKLITMRNEFMASYFKAGNDPEKRAVITEYENRLTDYQLE